MDWLFPLLMISVGSLTILFSRVLENYLSKRHNSPQAQGNTVLQRHFDLYEIYGRMQSRVLLSWALIGFGSVWILTNLV